MRQSEISDVAWRSLARTGGWAALIAAIIFRRWLGAELGLFQSMGILHFGTVPATGNVAGWFGLIQANQLVGFTLLNGFDLVNYALVGLMLLGLYAALGKADSSAMTLATAVGLVGVAIYFASNQALPLLSLSGQYAAATDDAQQSMLLAAGRTLLTTNDFFSGSGVAMAFYLVNLAELIIACVMLRTREFGGVTAYLGIAANVFGLGVILTLPFAPAMTFVPMSASAPFLLAWYILIGVRLLRMARRGAPDSLSITESPNRQ
jgi:hypothetical protein